MKIDDRLLGYLEDLSCLTLQPEEREPLQKDLSDILRFMSVLDTLDISGAEALSHPFSDKNAFRDDCVVPSADRTSILSNAANHTSEYFKAPLTTAARKGDAQ